MTPTAQLIHRPPRVVHDHNWSGGLLWALVAVLLLGFIDQWDNADFWQKEAMKAHAEVAKREALESMPNPAIVLDARTAEQFGIRLAEIAGGLDGERMKARGK